MNEYQQDALNELIKHQTQLDFDGIRVGVSRQALDEILEWVTMMLSTMEGSKER